MSVFRGRKGRALLICGGTLLGLFLFCALAFAGGGGEHEAAQDSGKVKDLVYRIINFGLMVIILFVVIRKTAIKDFFRTRREEIRQKMEDLQKEKEASENRHRELEQKLKEFEERKKEIIEQFKAEGAEEKERIIAEAKERAAQILAQADVTIQREVQAAKDRLSQEMVEIAATRAQELIAKNITEDDQDHLVAEFIEKVEKLH